MNSEELRVLAAQGRLRFVASGERLTDGGFFTLAPRDAPVQTVIDEGEHATCAQVLGMLPTPPLAREAADADAEARAPQPVGTPDADEPIARDDARIKFLAGEGRIRHEDGIGFVIDGEIVTSADEHAACAAALGMAEPPFLAGDLVRPAAHLIDPSPTLKED